MAKIGYKETLRALKRVVKAKPDTVVHNCVYTYAGGEAGCLIGHVMDRVKVERPGADAEENEWRFDTIPQYHLFTHKAADLLQQAQDAQDAHKPWRTALEYALSK